MSKNEKVDFGPFFTFLLNYSVKMDGFSKFQNFFLLTMGPAFQCNLNFLIRLRDKKVGYRARFGQKFRENEKTRNFFSSNCPGRSQGAGEL